MSTSIRQPAIWKTLQLSGGDKIIASARYADDGSSLSLPDINHNVYRLNPAGEVVWQVRRDDSIMPPDWWENMHRIAREQGQDGKRKPFTYLVLEYQDGSRVTSDEQGDGTDIALWEPGSIIHLYGSGNDYVLDPETGIAKNVESGPGRPW
jgi:hypothetical protein